MRRGGPSAQCPEGVPGGWGTVEIPVPRVPGTEPTLGLPQRRWSVVPGAGVLSGPCSLERPTESERLRCPHWGAEKVPGARWPPGGVLGWHPLSCAAWPFGGGLLLVGLRFGPFRKTLGTQALLCCVCLCECGVLQCAPHALSADSGARSTKVVASGCLGGSGTERW